MKLLFYNCLNKSDFSKKYILPFSSYTFCRAGHFFLDFGFDLVKYAPWHMTVFEVHTPPRACFAVCSWSNVDSSQWSSPGAWWSCIISQPKSPKKVSGSLLLLEVSAFYKSIIVYSLLLSPFRRRLLNEQRMYVYAYVCMCVCTANILTVYLIIGRSLMCSHTLMYRISIGHGIQ